MTIFEATDRAGGRIHTYRDPINPSKYIGELGAMRFPLNKHPYLNSLIRQRYKMNITEFSNFNDNIYTYVNGIFAAKKQVYKNSSMSQFSASERERGKVRRCSCTVSTCTDVLREIFCRFLINSGLKLCDLLAKQC